MEMGDGGLFEREPLAVGFQRGEGGGVGLGLFGRNVLQALDAVLQGLDLALILLMQGVDFCG
ncbi:MAG: hypothetical protein U0903_00220 [Planctomycetales bacterium]